MNDVSGRRLSFASRLRIQEWRGYAAYKRDVEAGFYRSECCHHIEATTDETDDRSREGYIYREMQVKEFGGTWQLVAIGNTNASE
jgi:hypothetical protein